ncbi:MAG: hypothetical protein AAB372_04320 [Patescibacteria group bacterium]
MENTIQRHPKLAFVSFILGLIPFVFALFFVSSIAVFENLNLGKFILIATPLGLLAGVAPFVGVFLGITAYRQKDVKKGLAIVGVLLNGLVILYSLVTPIIGQFIYKKYYSDIPLEYNRISVTMRPCDKEVYTHTSFFRVLVNNADNTCHLHFYANNHLKEIPNDIKKLKNLKTLNVYGNDIASEEMERVKQLLPNTRIISEPSIFDFANQPNF